MKSNFDNCFAITVGQEGGYDRNPKDRGNWTSGKIGVGELKGTKYGIAAFVYPNVDIENLTVADAKAIYAQDYWPKVAGDQQPIGVDLVAWDICVNSGAARAIKIEADALGVDNKRPDTLATFAQGRSDKVDLIKRMCAARATFYQSLSTFQTFGKGWLRRNATIEAQGVRMALGATGMAPEKQKDRLNKEANQAGGAAKKNAGGATAGTAGGAAGGLHPDIATFGKIALAVAVVVLVIYCVRQYLAHRERQAAYQAAAAGTIN